jgi:hypothetical protein
VTEPPPEFVDVRVIVERVASCEIHGEQVSKVGLEQSRVCPEILVGFRRGGVCARGPVCTLVVCVSHQELVGSVQEQWPLASS